MSTFCTHCGNNIGDEDRFCRACGAPAGVAATTSLPVTAPGSTTTSMKAVLSLVFGVCFFFFPISIVAIILGHLALSEIKKSSGRLTGEGLATAGLVLGYIGVAAIPMILIIAAIAIPNLLRARMAANESSAVASVRTIVTAQVSYWGEHTDTGYACSLAALGEAQKIDNALASGRKLGYRFEITGCEADIQGGANTKYKVVAYPITANQTGVRAFCSDESAIIKVNAGGSARNCLENGVVLQ
jgi:type IV pilus assembly protein PilA